MTFDIGEILAERAYATTEVSVYLNEAASYTKAQLIKAHAKANAEDVKDIDSELAKVEELLENSKYTIHLKSVPAHVRESIQNDAFKRYPVKPDMWGNDSHENATLRMKYENNLIWQAQIERVVNPRGEEKANWSYTEVEQLAGQLPTAVTKAIDAAIKTLTEESEQYTLAGQSIDFS